MNRIRAPRLWPLILVAALLAGCAYYPFGPRNPPPAPLCDDLAQQEQSPDNLLFETIARNFVTDNLWESKEPALFVLTSAEDVSAIEQYIRPDAAAALKATDFDGWVVLAAFSGWKGVVTEQFCVTSITQQQGQIFLHTHLIDSPIGLPAAASPYHLLRLLRDELPSGEVAFHLALTRHDYDYTLAQFKESAEESVVSVTHSLP
jgi:hypothetical protein